MLNHRPIAHLLFASMFLTSCVSTTKVHLFIEGVPEEELREFDELLEVNGFDVVHNTLPVPEGVTTPTIVYSPTHRQLGKIEALRDQLDENGLPFDLTPVSSGNHFYTGVNIGIYPRAFVPGKPREISLLGKELSGECADVDAYLELRADLTFTAEVISWNDSNDSEVRHATHGNWWQTKETVTLAFDKDETEYVLTRFSEKTDYAKVDGLRLEKRSDNGFLEDCAFAYRELDPW